MKKFSFLSCFQRFLQCFGELIRAGCGLVAAADAGEAADGVLDIHAADELFNPLCVAGAAAGKFDAFDRVAGKLDVNAARADALGGIVDGFHGVGLLLN